MKEDIRKLRLEEAEVARLFGFSILILMFSTIPILISVLMYHIAMYIQIGPITIMSNILSVCTICIVLFALIGACIGGVNAILINRRIDEYQDK